MEKITEDELSSLRYFWEYKGDLERYTGFERLKPQLEEQYPEIMKAWRDYKASIKILDAVMETVNYEE